MCGIFGIVSLTGAPLLNAEARVGSAIAAMRHRGPDSQGVFVSRDGCVALGHARLAIVDPSSQLPQPLVTPDGNGVLSFNGEVYNHRELRQRLTQNGAGFRSSMDTEVLLNGLCSEGIGFLDRVDGMWSFAFYDQRTRRLTLSRDVMGERHLFFVKGSTELVFSSEVRPILMDGAESGGLDFDCILSSLQFNSAPVGKTLLRNVRRLRPGVCLEVAPSGHTTETYNQRLRPEKWMDFFRNNPSLDQVLDQFSELMLEYALRRVPDEVPYFATLSGGLDSTTVCLFASEYGKRHIRTLFGYSSDAPRSPKSPSLTEFEASQYTAEKLGSTHHSIRLHNEACIPLLHEFAANGFDGLIDGGTVSFEMLGRKVREEGAKVILISDGPDELIGGYPVDLLAYKRDQLRIHHPWAYSLLGAANGGILRRRVMRRLVPPHMRFLPEREVGSGYSEPVHQALSPDILARIVLPGFLNTPHSSYGFVDDRYELELNQLDPTQRRSLAYATKSLPDMFNLRTDKAFLRTSVESRVPFQAPAIVEFLLAAPAPLRFAAGTTTKYLLRKLVERHLGPTISERPKVGFSAPLWADPKVRSQIPFEEVIRESQFFRDFPFKKGAQETVLSPKLRKFRWPFYVLCSTYEALRGIDSER